MNHHYKIVWNACTCGWVAVAETVRGRGKTHSLRRGAASRTGLALCGSYALQPLVWSLCAVGLAFAAPPAATQLPTGGQVVAGQARISPSGAATLNIQQTSAQAVVDWQTFNVGSAAAVQFMQPNSASTILNRVLDSNPSQIWGRISAPGQVFFSNPNGMVFAKGASVDVGSLTATTHSISNADFMAGQYRFTRNGATGAILNQGDLKAGLGGYIALLAPEVRNQGVIVAQLGTVALAAGEVIELQMQGQQLSALRVSPATVRALVENGQAVQAQGGLVILSAQAVDQLQGSVVHSGGVISANALQERNGRIVLDASGTVQVNGVLQVNSDSGKAGQITLTADTVNLLPGAQLQAQGATGGGTVLVGGDWQGSNGIRQATKVSMDAGASIDASATQNGDGGKVVLWSDVHNAESQTTVHGSILARGGAQGGDGGKIETSGHRVDIVGATINAGSDQGAGGLWLLDPYNYTIDAAEALTIQGSLDTGTSFTVDTTNASGSGLTGSSGTGVITVNNAIAKTAGGAATLTLNAADSIVLNANISTTVSSLNVNMTASSGNISGSGNFALRNGMVTFNQATDGIYSGVIGDPFPLQLTKSGAGTLIITGANGSRASGNQVSVNGGTLQIGNNGTVGSFASTTMNIASGATLAYKRSDDQTLSSVINGAGSVSQLANSNLTLTNNFGAGFTGDLIINAGQLTLSSPNDNTFTGSAIRINNGSSLGLNSTRLSRTYRLGTNIIFDASGGGTVKLMQNTTNLIVSGSLTFTTNGGAQNRFYSTVGANWGLNTTSTGNVIFNTAAGTSTATADLSIEVPMVNGGVITKNGAGSVAITADPTSGLTTLPYNTVAVNVGTYRVGNGGAAGQLGSGAVSVASGATLAFNRSDNISVTNAITGLGALSKEGNNTLTLPNNPAYSGPTHINGGTLVWQNDAPTTSSSGFDGTGILTIQPNSGSFSSAFSTTGWSLGNTLSGLNLGKSGNTSGITVPNAISIAGPINLFGGDLAINAALTATGTNTISLNSSGTVTDGASGALSASNLLLSGGNVTLDSTSNAIGTLAATGVSGLTFVNGAALTLGTLGATNGVSASGVVAVSTTSGDLTVSQAVSTSNTTANALTLNAGSAAAAGVAAGGNLLISGSGAVSVGAGGAATLYSGSIGGSTGLATLVGGNGSGRFRYGSDEGTTNYSLALGTGLNAIYRQQPTITRAVNDQTIAYGDALTNTFSVSDSVNGDTYSQAFGSATTPTVTVGGSTSTSGKYTAGTHTLSATGGATSSQLGYAVASGTTSGTLTVNAKTLTVAFSGVNKTYDGSQSATATSTDDRLAGDALTVNDSAAFADKNVGTGKAVSISGISLSGTDAGNYSLATTTANTTANITAKTLNLSYSGVNKVYDGGLSASVTRSDDRISGDVLRLSQSAAFTDKNVGTAKTVNVSAITLSGADAGNYNLASTTTATTADITAKTLNLSYSGVNKVYDGGLSASVTRSDDRISGDVLTLSQSAAFGDKNVGTGKAVSVTAISLSGADAGNYNLVSSTASTTADISKAILSVTGNDAFKTQDGLAYQGGNGVQYAGWIAGDTPAVLKGQLVYGGASQGAILPGDFPLVPSGLDALNYQIKYVPGTLTVNAAVAAAPNPRPLAMPKTEGVTDLRGASEIRPAALELGQLTDVARDPCGPAGVASDQALAPDASGVVFKWLAQPDGQAAVGLSVLVPHALAVAPEGFAFQLPLALLSCASKETRVRVTGEQGQDLPAWLAFDGAGQRLVAQQVPADGLPLRLWMQAGGQRRILEITPDTP